MTVFVDTNVLLRAEEARDEISRLEGFFSVLPESAEVYSEWKRLVAMHKVQGVVTFNADDFRRYGSITVTLPS